MHISNSIRAVLGAALSLCFLNAEEYRGQVTFGSLPLPGAQVTASNSGRTVTAVTDAQGAWTFADLADGTWRMKVEMLCFVTQEREVTVAAGAPADTWDLKLRPIEEVNAVAAPPTFQRAQMTETPKPQRSPDKAVPAAAQPDPETAAELSQRAADGLLINGSNNNGASSRFAMAGAFGNMRKGPRSLYNGSLGLNFDNSRFDARPFSLTGQDTARPTYNHLTGLLSFGGPLKIPGLLRNGPTIIVNYQWTRDRNATTQSGLMPTTLERTGDFSQSLLRSPLIDPATGAPFPNNRIPESRISPQALSLLRLYPLPNFAGGSRYNFQLPLLGATHQDNLQARANKAVGRRDQLSGGLAYQSTRSDTTNLFGFLDTTDIAGINANVSWRHNVTTRLSFLLGYQFSRLSTDITPFFEQRTNISGAAGITGNNQELRNWGPPQLNFTGGISTLNDVTPSTVHNETNAINAAMLWNFGRHNLTFGADLRRQQFNQLAQQDPRGTFTFTGNAAGSDFAGFLIGVPDTSSIAFGNADKYFRAWANDAYFADDWRVNPGLTINAGVRWEYGSPIDELYGRLVNLDIAPGFTSVAPLVARDTQRALLNPDKGAIQPRVGISWRPMAATSMVIRAGYGVYYNTSVYLPIATQMAQQAPLSKSLSVQNTATNPLTLANGFNLAPGITATTFAVDPYFRIGYAQTWNASIQRDLPAALVIVGTYLGTKGTRGMQVFLPNTYPTGATNPCPTCPTGFSYLASNGNSIRHSAQLQLRRRLRSGLTGSFQYVLSKSIDDSALGGRGQAANVIAQNWLDLSAERALSSFDQRHAITTQLQYTTGMGMRFARLMNGRIGTLLKEWTWSGQLTAGSGLPLTPNYPSAVNGTGVTGSIRPDYTGAPLYDAPAGLSVNPAAFTAPALGHWGNAGRNTIDGPAQFNFGASAGRVFRFGDRASLDFRVDAANAINHVTYTSWYTNITSTQFGLPVNANAMRTVQTTLRVRF